MESLKLLFQGDSITDSGRSKNVDTPNVGLGSGYVSLVASRLLVDHPESQIYNRAVSGNRIVDMYARWTEDALNLPFNVISILNGANDVGYGLRLNCGAGREKFRLIYDMLLQETKEAHPDADIVLCQPFLMKRRCDFPDNPFGSDIYENWETWNGEIHARGEIIRELAEKYGAVFVEFQSAIDEALTRAPAEHWSADCVHMTLAGNEMLARKWLADTEHILKKYW